MEKMMKVGTKIKKLRELKNYTQEYMAQALSLSPNGYGKIERDEVDVTLGRLEDIAKILEIDIFQILAFDEKQIFNISNNHNTYGSIHAQQFVNDEGFRLLITHLQEENKHLRTENNRLLSLLEKKSI
jgi:transcriptional regulator with XRE-family HTH domain